MVGAQARELNEKYQILERSNKLAADTASAVTAAVTKASNSEAVSKCTQWGKGFLAKAGEKAGEAMVAAKAKVDAMQAAPGAAAPATQ